MKLNYRKIPMRDETGDRTCEVHRNKDDTISAHFGASFKLSHLNQRYARRLANTILEMLSSEMIILGIL